MEILQNDETYSISLNNNNSKIMTIKSINNINNSFKKNGNNLIKSSTSNSIDIKNNYNKIKAKNKQNLMLIESELENLNLIQYLDSITEEDCSNYEECESSISSESNYIFKDSNSEENYKNYKFQEMNDNDLITIILNKNNINRFINKYADKSLVKNIIKNRNCNKSSIKDKQKSNNTYINSIKMYNDSQNCKDNNNNNKNNNINYSTSNNELNDICINNKEILRDKQKAKLYKKFKKGLQKKEHSFSFEIERMLEDIGSQVNYKSDSIYMKYNKYVSFYFKLIIIIITIR